MIMDNEDTADEPINVEEPRSRDTLIIGVGTAGCNIASHIAIEWPDGPAVLAIDTAHDALETSTATWHCPIGGLVTHGLSTGGSVEVCRQAVEEHLDQIVEQLEGVELAFVVVGLGGGTGSCAAPMIGHLLKAQQAHTISIVTTPFAFEDEPTRDLAESALHQLKGVTDVLVKLPNRDLQWLVGEAATSIDVFKKSDELAGSLVRTLWQVLKKTGMMNVDLGKLRNALEGENRFSQVIEAEATGEDRVNRLWERIQKHPYLTDQRIQHKASTLIVHLTGGTGLLAKEVELFNAMVSSFFNQIPDIKYAVAIEEAWLSRLSATLLFGLELEAPVEKTSSTEKKPAIRSTVTPDGTRTDGKPKVIKKAVQIGLNLETPGRGRFKGVRPTYHEGEDLDIPTFIRRGIKIAKIGELGVEE